MRNELGQGLADGLGGSTKEDLLGGGIEEADKAIGIDGEDGVAS